MTANSMQKYIDPNYVVGKVSLLISEKRNQGAKEITIILVEGSSDQKMFGIMTNHSNCVIVVTDGKTNAVEALNMLSRKYPKGVIAIVDNDFDSLTGNYVDNENIITSDTHDIETMIIASPALKKYVALLMPPYMYSRVDAITEDIRKKILEIAKPLGCLRWVVHENKCGMSLKNIEFREIVDIQRFSIKIEELINKRGGNNSYGNCAKSTIKASVREKASKQYDPWQICQGHDLINILIVVLPNLLPSYYTINTSEQKDRFDKVLLEKAGSHYLATDWLVGCYESEYFKKTRMYEKISAWEEKNKPYKVFEFNYVQ